MTKSGEKERAMAGYWAWLRSLMNPKRVVAVARQDCLGFVIGACATALAIIGHIWLGIARDPRYLVALLISIPIFLLITHAAYRKVTK